MKLSYIAILDITDNSEVRDQEQLNTIQGVFDRAFDKVVNDANIFMEDKWSKRVGSYLQEIKPGNIITIKG